MGGWMETKLVQETAWRSQKMLTPIFNWSGFQQAPAII